MSSLSLQAYSQFAPGSVKVCGDARPGALDRYESSKAGMRHHDEAEAALAKEGWLKLQTTRDPRRWKPRYFECDVRKHTLSWWRDKSKSAVMHKPGWELNLQNAQIVLLEKLEYDKMSGPTEVWDLVDPDTDSTSNTDGEAPEAGRSFDMIAQHQTASHAQIEEALTEMCRVMVLRMPPLQRRDASTYLEETRERWADGVWREMEWLREAHLQAQTQGGAVWDNVTWEQRYEIMLRYQKGILERDMNGVPLHEDMAEDAEADEEPGEVDVYKYGYLEKMGQVNTKWQKRFFELKDGLLAYWCVTKVDQIRFK